MTTPIRCLNPSSSWVLVLLPIAVLTGCSTTIPARRPIDAATATEVVLRAGHRRVEIEVDAPTERLGASDWRTGELLGTSAGSFLLLEDEAKPSTKLTQIPIDRTRAVSYRLRARGGAEGALLGALPGLLLGAWLGGGIESKTCSSDTVDRQTCKHYTLGYALTGAALTAVIGAVIGALRGHRTTYRFSQ